MNSLVDADIDDIQRKIGESRVGADSRISVGVRASDIEVDFIRSEEQLEHLSEATHEGVRSRALVRIIRGIDERLPIGITDSVLVAVVVAFAYGGDGPPSRVLELALPGGD